VRRGKGLNTAGGALGGRRNSIPGGRDLLVENTRRIGKRKKGKVAHRSRQKRFGVDKKRGNQDPSLADWSELAGRVKKKSAQVQHLKGT